MIRQQSESAAINDYRTPDRVLGRFQITDDLLQADECVLFLQNVPEIHFDGAKQVDQGPGGAPCLIEDIVQFGSGGFDFLFR